MATIKGQKNGGTQQNCESGLRLGPRELNLVSNSYNGRLLADSYHRLVVDYNTGETGDKGGELVVRQVT